MDDRIYKSPLHKMVMTTDTDLWNDSCSIAELSSAIEHGAVGATANPVIVGQVLNKELELWEPCIEKLIAEYPTATEDEIAWKLTEEMSVKAAGLLRPIFDREKGKNGRLSIQTNPQYFRNADLIVAQAVHFDALAPNMIVKIPVTEAGVGAIEEATWRGISINATVCFSVPQAVAVAEAVERGLERRRKAGEDISRMGPVCTIMVGRLDDWLKEVANRQDIVTDPAHLDWAGVAVMKKAYRLFRERGYTARLLSAATRHHRHWSEFIGADMVVTLTPQWQRRLNASDIEVVPRIDDPVDPEIVDGLLDKFADFGRAYEEQGLAPGEFDGFGPTRKTLYGFTGACQDLVRVIRGYLLPGVG
ncbi:MAG: transaldolase [Proteobacteria bacterium]|nr:transaldolase [Pseudomonadota bacterium]